MTGKKNDKGKEAYAAIPVRALREVAKVMTLGIEKYSFYNYLSGMDYSRLYSANQRHLNSFWDNKDFDEEDGLHHIAHACCCSLMMLELILRKLPNDDRFQQTKPEEPRPLVSLPPHLRRAVENGK